MFVIWILLPPIHIQKPRSKYSKKRCGWDSGSDWSCVLPLTEELVPLLKKLEEPSLLVRSQKHSICGKMLILLALTLISPDSRTVSHALLLLISYLV